MQICHSKTSMFNEGYNITTKQGNKEPSLSIYGLLFYCFSFIVMATWSKCSKTGHMLLRNAGNLPLWQHWSTHHGVPASSVQEKHSIVPDVRALHCLTGIKYKVLPCVNYLRTWAIKKKSSGEIWMKCLGKHLYLIIFCCKWWPWTIIGFVLLITKQNVMKAVQKYWKSFL